MNILIITYYWPPAGGPGVQRVLKFAKYLPEFGCRPVVLTVVNGEYPATDESLMNEVPSSLSVYTTPSLEPFALYRNLTSKKSDAIPTFVLTESANQSLFQKVATFLRANIFIPDARIGWTPFAVRQGGKIIRDEKIDVIFSTGPPMSTHLIGRRLAKKMHIPWVADFRDPWTDVFYYHSLKRTKCALALDKSLERSVLKNAHAVISVSPSIIHLFRAKAENSYHVIANGFDEHEFESVQPLPVDDKIHIIHAGHLAGNQNPVALWNALKNIVQKNPDFGQRLQVDFYGSVHSEVANSIQEFGLEHFTVWHGYKSHQHVIAAYKSAHALFFVVPQCDTSKGILTSKLFDYLGANRPIVGIGATDGDAAAILRKTGAGIMFDYDETQALTKHLEHIFYDRKRQHKIQTEKYTRRALTARLADIVKELV